MVELQCSLEARNRCHIAALAKEAHPDVVPKLGRIWGLQHTWGGGSVARILLHTYYSIGEGWHTFGVRKGEHTAMASSTCKCDVPHVGPQILLSGDRQQAPVTAWGAVTAWGGLHCSYAVFDQRHIHVRMVLHRTRLRVLPIPPSSWGQRMP